MDGHEVDLPLLRIVVPVVAGDQADAVEVGKESWVEVVRIVLPGLYPLDEAFDVEKFPARRFFVFLVFRNKVAPVIDVLHEHPYFFGKPLFSRASPYGSIR